LLVAKWQAIIDQPFTAVESPEFKAMLNYIHLHKLPNKINLPTSDKAEDTQNQQVTFHF
jgi:hypothetical protein